MGPTIELVLIRFIWQCNPFFTPTPSIFASVPSMSEEQAHSTEKLPGGTSTRDDLSSNLKAANIYNNYSNCQFNNIGHIANANFGDVNHGELLSVRPMLNVESELLSHLG